MSETKTIDVKTSETSQPSLPPPEEVDIVCRWWDRKEEVDSGLITTVRTTEAGTSCIGFALEDVDYDRDHYQDLLRAKVYDVFGVSDIDVAIDSFLDCINLMTTSQRLVEKEPEVDKERFGIISRNVMSLFQEAKA